jgi:hypothetical protein
MAAGTIRGVAAFIFYSGKEPSADSLTSTYRNRFDKLFKPSFQKSCSHPLFTERIRVEKEEEMTKPDGLLVLLS